MGRFRFRSSTAVPPIALGGVEMPDSRHRCRECIQHQHDKEMLQIKLRWRRGKERLRRQDGSRVTKPRFRRPAAQIARQPPQPLASDAKPPPAAADV